MIAGDRRLTEALGSVCYDARRWGAEIFDEVLGRGEPEWVDMDATTLPDAAAEAIDACGGRGALHVHAILDSGAPLRCGSYERSSGGRLAWRAGTLIDDPRAAGTGDRDDIAVAATHAE